MIRSVIAAIKNSYKLLCKQESDNLWCRGKLLISIKRAMNSSRIELLWLVWDQSRSKYYLRTGWNDKPQKCQNVCYHPMHQQQSLKYKKKNQQQSDFLILVLYDFIVQRILSSLLLLSGADPGFVVREGVSKLWGFEELQTFIWTTILNQPHHFYQTKKTWLWVLILSDNCSQYVFVRL